MAYIIVKLADDKYIEWSTVADGPVTYVCTRKQMGEHLTHTARDESDNYQVEQRLERADKYGSSLHKPTTAQEILAGNRAGPNESELTLDQIISSLV